jgi:signal peptidase I
MLEVFFSLITPLANIFWFGLLNLVICLISIHWIYVRNQTGDNPKQHRALQSIGLVLALLAIGILWIKQWNIGDLLAFYTVFSGVVYLSTLNLDKNVLKEARGWFLSILFVFVIRGYIYEPWQIPSSSMKPNLEIGDFVLVNRNAYGLEIPFTGRAKILSRSPEIGEVVVFFPPHKPTTPFVKRVIAKGGDKVTYANKKYFVNGNELEASFFSEDFSGGNLFYEQNNNLSYVIRKIPSRLAVNGSWEIPEGSFFVSGDNRDNSSDSREWGYITEDVIWGRADFIWMSWPQGNFPNFSRVGKVE